MTRAEFADLLWSSIMDGKGYESLVDLRTAVGDGVFAPNDHESGPFASSVMTLTLKDGSAVHIEIKKFP